MLVLPVWCASLLLHEVKLRKNSSRLHAEPSRLAAASAAVVSNSSTMSYSFFLNALRWPRALLLELKCTCFLRSLAEHVHDKEVSLVIALPPCALLQWSPSWPHVPLSSWHSNTAISPRMTSSASTRASGSGRYLILPPLPVWPSTRFAFLLLDNGWLSL